MSPRQLLRLKETRRSDSFNDQLTPAEIAASETLAQNEQEFLNYVLSQIRQIIGTPRWKDAVPENLLSIAHYHNAFPAACLDTDSIGDCVYVRSNPVGGIYQVTRCDPSNLSKFPAVGIIRSKTSATACEVQFSGILAGVYGGMTFGKPLFVGAAGDLVHQPPDPAPGSYMYWQSIGSALGDEEVLIVPGPIIVKKG